MKKIIKTLALTVPFILSACTKMPAIEDKESNLATQAQLQNCNLLGHANEMETAYPDLLEKKWDRDQLGCGALYIYETAQQSRFGIELKLEALAAQLNYFDVLSRSYPKLYQSGALGDELNELWRATRQRSENLIASVEYLDGFIAEINLLKGAYLLANTEKDSTVKEAISALPPALTLIQDAVQRKPDAADGLGLYLLGRMKLTMPSFIGGDTDEAIELFEKAILQQPNNLEIHRWLLQSYAATGEVENEMNIITKASKIIDDNINGQDLADLYIIYGGSAHRYNMKNEIAFFSQQRKKLFNEKPYLLTRESGANRGHGGTDPITGTDPNAI